MFAAAFLPNLLCFVTGQAAAWYYLHTGRFWVGLASTVALWVLFDVWLVARFVFAVEATDLQWTALALQAVAWVTVGALAFGLWRRRWSATARARTSHFGQGMTQFLRNDYAAARATFVRLVRTDPWDVAAWIALGDVFDRTGESRRAQRCYRRAGSVDTQGAFTDLLRLRRGLPRAG